MKRTAILLTVALTLITAACGGDSKLPTATGKASVRAINAIKTSPNVVFRIEERIISDLPYQDTSGVSEYDDLDYTFNFDIVYAGANAETRIASQHIDFAAGQEYTLLLSGTIANPVLTVWETTEREFSADGTVLQVRFSHNSEFLAVTDLDYYMAPAGVLPAAGEEVATVAFGDISPPLDVEAGILVLTITSAGNPTDILYTSDEVGFAESTDIIITPFDSTPSRNSDFTVHVLGGQSGTTELADSGAQATVEFLHASSDLGTVHIYDDEALTSQVLADHMYTDLSADIPIAPGAITYRYTPTDTSSILVEGDLFAVAGTRYRFAVLGVNTEFSTAAVLPDTRSHETSSRILLTQVSNNFDIMAFYLLTAGEMVDEDSTATRVLSSLFNSASIDSPAGDYDAYLTDATGETILAGPVNLNIALGDVLELMVFDDPMDPAVLDLQILTGP